MNLKIDLVYTWVNGSDLEYHEVVNRYAENPRDLNPERYRDEYQMLKYSLRSVEKYLNWINRIFIVTARPQVPAWLNTNHPQISLIHHNEIIDNQYLPTFNPNCIESFLHKIPGLSEHFIYMNDDFLFGSETSIEDFMPKGKYRVFNTLVGENLPWRIYDGKNDIIGLGIIEHTPLFINQQYWEEMTKLFPIKMHKTRSNKFRKPDDLMTYKFYRYHMLKHHRQECMPIPIWELLQINTFHKITNNLQFQQSAFRKLERKRPKYYCLNDDQRDHPNQEVVALVKDFLINYYSLSSDFEIPERETSKSFFLKK